MHVVTPTWTRRKLAFWKHFLRIGYNRGTSGLDASKGRNNVKRHKQQVTLVKYVRQHKCT